MSKRFFQLLFLMITSRSFFINAGIGAQFDTDQYVKAMTANEKKGMDMQKVQEGPISTTPPLSPRSILKNTHMKKQEKQPVSFAEEGRSEIFLKASWSIFIDLLKCLERGS